MIASGGRCAGLLLFSLAALPGVAAQPVTITFEDIHHLPVNSERVQTFTWQGVEFTGGSLWRFGGTWYGASGQNAIVMNFPAGATEISFRVNGYGRSILFETMPLEVRDGNVGGGKLIATIPIPSLNQPLVPIVNEITVGTATTSRVTIFTRPPPSGLPLPHYGNTIVIDDVRYTPAPPAGDLVPLQPVFAPHRPEPADDTRVVADTGPGLDTRCSFHGSLNIDLPVRRVVGAVDASGQLLDSLLLLGNRHLSKTATLQLAAYDVDDEEVDEVYFNGRYLGLLKGQNNEWSENKFIIPIE
ncbi:MAG TPA: hypothetical protein VM534_01465 [Thermoanaerobaculia bacterium]|nr:hypothetical protein [Thermoanaerobaculia bacterium]